MGGYFKVWRKIEDSKSWSRGALYRGLMITLLQKVSNSSFLKNMNCPFFTLVTL